MKPPKKKKGTHARTHTHTHTHTPSLPHSLLAGKKAKASFEEVAENEDTQLTEKKRQFPGLCIPDDRSRPSTLIDVKVATGLMDELEALKPGAGGSNSVGGRVKTEQPGGDARRFVQCAVTVCVCLCHRSGKFSCFYCCVVLCAEELVRRRWRRGTGRADAIVPGHVTATGGAAGPGHMTVTDGAAGLGLGAEGGIIAADTSSVPGPVPVPRAVLIPSVQGGGTSMKNPPNAREDGTSNSTRTSSHTLLFPRSGFVYLFTCLLVYVCHVCLFVVLRCMMARWPVSCSLAVSFSWRACEGGTRDWCTSHRYVQCGICLVFYPCGVAIFFINYVLS